MRYARGRATPLVFFCPVKRQRFQIPWKKICEAASRIGSVIKFTPFSAIDKVWDIL